VTLDGSIFAFTGIAALLTILPGAALIGLGLRLALERR
jgi:hypothetical protein